MIRPFAILLRLPVLGLLLLTPLAAAEPTDTNHRRGDHDQTATGVDVAAPPAASSGSAGGGGLTFPSGGGGGGGGGGGDGRAWVVVLVIVAASLAVVLPILVTQDHFTDIAHFPRYPYERPGSAYLRMMPDQPGSRLGEGGWCGLRTSTDLLAARSGQVVTGAALLETPWRLGLAVEGQAFHPAPDRAGLLPHGTASAQATLRFAQASWAEFRIGLGATMVEQARSFSGVGCSYECDLFPIEPLVVHLHYDWSHPRPHILSMLSATAGITWHGAELYEGYGRLRYDGHHVDGPLAGLRWWF